MACCNCGNSCGCNGGQRRNCRRLANEVYDLIEDIQELMDDLEDAWDALEDEGCIRGLEETTTPGCGCGCGCNRPQPRNTEGRCNN